jgi:hypothetical protein
VAFAFVGAVTANHKTSSSTWSISVSIAANRLVVLILALDNLDASDGDFGVVTGVTDNGNNTWKKAAEFTNGQGGAGAGACNSIWYSVTAAAATSLTITLRAALTAKAAIIATYSIASGAMVAVAATGTRADDAIDPGNISLTDLESRQYLFLRGIAGETNSTTNITATPDWTALPNDQTSGGGAVTNMAVRGEFRIITATSIFSDPTWLSVSADNASVLVAFYEVLGAPVITGSATLSGAGSLSASGLSVVIASATAPGTGTSSSTALLTVFATATIPGVGSGSASGGLVLAGSAALTGAGTISAVGERVIVATASASGIGSLTSGAVIDAIATAVLPGTGDLLGTPVLDILVAAAAAGVASVSVRIAGTRALAAAAAGIASVSVRIAVTRALAAAAAGIATVAAALTTTAGGAAEAGRALLIIFRMMLRGKR